MKKTKILSTTVTTEDTVLIETADGFVELVAGSRTHRYLGRAWSGNLRTRGMSALGHRISCAWMKFRSVQPTLLNRHVSVKLRLKLFNAAVTPAALYSLETCPLSHNQLEQLDITQRKMMRRIVGWVYDADDSWEDAGRRMKDRLKNALEQQPIISWSAAIRKRKSKLLFRVTSNEAPRVTKMAFEWSPPACALMNETQPGRRRGHPRQRWQDSL